MVAEKQIAQKQISGKAAGEKRFRGKIPQGEGITTPMIAKREQFLKILHDLEKVGKMHTPPWLDMEGGECKIGELIALSGTLVSAMKTMENKDVEWALKETAGRKIRYFDLQGYVAKYMNESANE